MVETQERIDALADRIEHAYRLLRADWRGGCSTPRVWTVAAMVLLQVHANDPTYPMDPELFVASQPRALSYPDPWAELTGSQAAKSYRRRVRAIIRTLFRELAAEVKWAEARIDAGETIGKVLLRRSGTISPLGKLIVAHRLGRPTLARRFANDALAQHDACPLYREASRTFLASELYPVRATPEPAAGAAFLARPRSRVPRN